MTPKIRKIIAGLFIAAFLSTAPLILLYTSGYGYDWKKHRIEKTGIIQTDSAPQGASIALNGVPQKRTTPASFTRLLPEDYRLRFEKQGFLPWEKTVEVRSGETAFVTDALLFKDSLPRLLYGEEISQAAFTADGRREALVRDDGKWRELSVLDADKTAPALLARYGGDTYTDSRLLWSPDGSRLLFASRGKDGAPVLLLYDIPARSSDATEPPRSLQDKFSAAKLDAKWSTDGSRIVALAAGGVFLLNPDDGSVSSGAIGAGIQDAILRGKDLFLLRQTLDGAALERRGHGNLAAVKPLLTLPAGRYRFLDASGPFLLLTEEGNGRLLAVSPDDGSVADTLFADSAAWLPKSKEPRLLAWNDFEITVSNLRTGEHSLVTRLGTRIQGCAWHPSGLAVIYATASGIEATDLDARGRRNIFDLVRFTDVGAFAVDPAGGVLRFVGAIGNRRGLYEKEY